VAILDSTIAGRNVSEWLGPNTTSRLSPRSGRRWPTSRRRSSSASPPPAAGCPTPGVARSTRAIDAGLDILSGLHTFLGDDSEFSSAAHLRGVSIVDYRRPPERMETSVGAPRPGKQVILTVGTTAPSAR